MSLNPELDEATATALCAVIHNQIEALKSWERKLKQPFLPQYGHSPRAQQHPKPTVKTVQHIMASLAHGRTEIVHVTEKFLATAGEIRYEEET